MIKNFIKQTYGSVVVDVEKRPLSYSSLKEFRKSPIHYLHYISQPKVESDAFTFGSLLDCLIFMPDTYKDRFVVAPKCDKRTTVGRDTWEKFVALNAKNPKTIITDDMLADAENMVSVLKHNKLAYGLIERCDNVQADFKFRDKDTKLPMRAVLDAYQKSKTGIAMDLKTSKDADENFSRDAYAYGYFLQTAIYLKALAQQGQFPDAFYNVVIEKKAPYGISVYKASDDYIKAGQDELERLLLEFKMCLEQKRFLETYEFKSVLGYQTLELPGYAKFKLQS